MLEINDGTAHLDGSLEHATVPGLLEQLADKLDNIKRIDLTKVTRSDSSGIALLLELTRLSPGTLGIDNMPAQMQAVARLCGVAELLERH